MGHRPCIGPGHCGVFTIPIPDTSYTYSNEIFLGAFLASFSVRAVDGQGHASAFSDTLWYVAGEAGPDVRPSSWTLYPNAPNPFNGQTLIRYSLAAPADVELTIFDVLGRHLITLANGIVAAGEHEALWDGRDQHGRELPSGVYFCRLRADGFEESRSMMLLK